MSEENEWDHEVSSSVKEGAEDRVMIPEVIAAMNKMKKHKAAGLSGPVADVIQATRDIGIQCLTDLCYGIIKEGCIRDHWKSSVVLPVYKPSVL